MNRCPITYLPCGKERYSPEGIKLLSPKIHELNDFPFTQSQQMELALESIDKLSIQGVQLKLSAQFAEPLATFKSVQRNGTYILKLQHRNFAEVPQNEDLTMRLAQSAGIEVPFHGLIYAIDGSMIYFIERFDRKKLSSVNLSSLIQVKKKKKWLHKISVEDFSQLAGLSRDTKYDFSMEKIIPLVEQYCSFPMAEKKKLFRLTLFSFLVGNEDLHVKNFSLIRHGELTEFSPAYDLVNSAILLKSKEELALPLHGKKSNLNRADLFTYYGEERLGLPSSVLNEIFQLMLSQIPRWKELIDMSFLSAGAKEAYLQLIQERFARLV